MVLLCKEKSYILLREPHGQMKKPFFGIILGHLAGKCFMLHVFSQNRYRALQPIKYNVAYLARSPYSDHIITRSIFCIDLQEMTFKSYTYQRHLSYKMQHPDKEITSLLFKKVRTQVLYE